MQLVPQPVFKKKVGLTTLEFEGDASRKKLLLRNRKPKTDDVCFFGAGEGVPVWCSVSKDLTEFANANSYRNDRQKVADDRFVCCSG